MLTPRMIWMEIKPILLGCALFLALSSSGLAAATTVKLIAFNDFHGNLESPGNFGVQAGGSGTVIVEHAAGGVDMMAAYIAGMRSKNPNNILVSAGDLIGASPLISAFFHDEATIEIMNRLHLAFNAVGNHEFDEGMAELLRMQQGGCHPADKNSCQGLLSRFKGAKFKFLAANVFDQMTKQTVLPAYGVKTFKTAKGKLRIGFIGLTLKETGQIVSPSGIKGLNFNDEAETVNALLPKLRAKGVQAIVVLLHQGGVGEAADGSFINDCPANLQNFAASPINAIVSRLDNAVDLVISGHSHSGFICQLPNKLGRAVPVTQAGSFGRVLTEIDMTFQHGKATKITATNITVDRSNPNYVPDLTIKGIVEHYAKLVTPLAKQTIGVIAEALPNAADPSGENVVGDLIADAQLQATAKAGDGNAQLAMINPGGIRGLGFLADAGGYPYQLNYGQAFALQPFANNLVTISLTAQQLKDVLEQQFVGNGCLLSDGVTQNQQTVQRILQVSNGFHVEWSAGAPA